MRSASNEHGTNGMYSSGCRCDPCVVAAGRYAKQLNYDHARGERRRVPADEVRPYVQELLDAGYTFQNVANAAGIAPSQVKRLMTGSVTGKPVGYVFRNTADALLAVSVSQLELQHAYVAGVGVARRIRALYAMGYGPKELAKEFDLSESLIYRMRDQGRTTRDKVRRVHEVYDRLAVTPGPSERARWTARWKGWAPPLAWDDDMIDNPDARPHPVRCVVLDCQHAATRHSLCGGHYRTLRQAGVDRDRFRLMCLKAGGAR